MNPLPKNPSVALNNAGNLWGAFYLPVRALADGLEEEHELPPSPCVSTYSLSFHTLPVHQGMQLCAKKDLN